MQQGPLRSATVTAFLVIAVLIPAVLPLTRTRGQQPARDRPASETRRPDVVYLPTPPEVVDRMLALADLKKGDVLYDLGCGDGRVVVSAAKDYGVNAVGLDIDPKRVKESRDNVRKNEVGDRVTIRQQDVFATDLTPADVVTMYLLPNLNLRLLPQLSRLKAGSRVVSHSFEIKGMTPKRVEKVRLNKGGVRTIYLYMVPFESTPSR